MRSRPWTRWSFPSRSAIAIAAALILLLGLALPPATAAAATHPTVYWGAKGGPIYIPATRWYTVARLPLPKGRYYVTATATLVGRPGPPYIGQPTTCRLVLGSEQDRVDMAPSPAGYDASHVPVLLTVAGRLGSPGYAKLRCRLFDTQDAVAIRDIRLTAIRTGKLTLQEGMGAMAKRVTLGSGRPRIISAQSDSGSWVTDDGQYRRVGSLDLAEGRWWVTAKAVVLAVGEPGHTSINNRCRLVAGADHDDLRFGLYTPGPAYADDATRLALGLQVVHQFGSAGKAVLECKVDDRTYVDHVVITAVKVGRLTNTPIGPAAGWTTGQGSPRVISGWDNGPAKIKAKSTYTSVRKLPLPKGRWVVLAKFWHEADMDDFAHTAGRTHCRLLFGKDSSPTSVRYTDSLAGWVAPLVLSVNHHAASSQPVKLQCRRSASTDSDKAYFIKITAMKAGKLIERPL